ncbi:chondroitin AC/alginate lyase [Lactarius hengduanensis]|nr:chondroitin AC/alginate lyase [Lactarius hengduanensis]
MTLLCAVVLSFLTVRSLADDLSVGFSPYDNDFIEPSYILGKNWNTTTVVAQEAIVQWADSLAAQGPWSVTTSKAFLAPSNNTHDYLSWAPYWWPNCSGVGNTTELTPQQIWVTCPYVPRDGEFNPDFRTVNNTGAFTAMSDAIFSNALAWAVNGSSVYSANVANWINTWFLAPDTYMNPNLNYAQVVRGPGANTGTHTGVLDLKCMTKVVNAVLVLRAGKAPEWTDTIDTGLVNWTTTYIGWLTSNKIALEEAAFSKVRRFFAHCQNCILTSPLMSGSNHGTFYYNQLAALQILVLASGEQPFEAERTRPVSLPVTNARLAAHIGFDAWNLTTSTGGSIKAALDFTMTVPPKDEPESELFPSVGAGAAVYGDPQGKYAAFLSRSQEDYPSQPWFFWDQPLSDSGWVRTHATSSGTGTAAAPTSSAGTSKNAAARTRALLDTPGELLLGVAIMILIHIFLFA